MILIIQTNIPGRLSVWGVVRGTIIVRRTVRVTYHGSEKLLPLIDRMLQSVLAAHQRLRGIGVVRGPGAFSAVRVGLIVANTLGQELGLPAAGIVSDVTLDDRAVIDLARQVQPSKTRRLVKPWYGREPNITKPKKKS